LLSAGFKGRLLPAKEISHIEESGKGLKAITDQYMSKCKLYSRRLAVGYANGLKSVTGSIDLLLKTRSLRCVTSFRGAKFQIFITGSV
jgi:hypothetical protein